MELALQFGHGMMEHSKVLVTAWGGGTVILSPRDLKPTQLTELAKGVTTLNGGRVLLDPQFYVPDADHKRLISHDYWPDQYATGTFWSGTGLSALLQKIIALNVSLGCAEVILPGTHADRVDDDWIARQKAVIEATQKLTNLPLLATIALSGDAVRSTDDIDEILVAAETWDVAGYYLVCEHPEGRYLITDPTWVTNVVDLAAGLRLKGKKVIVGYSSHQSLILACASTNQIASGNWLNVRSFPPDKFSEPEEEDERRNTLWYYCPHALSEYKLPFLDMAQKSGLLSAMAPDPRLGSKYADPLFASPQPSAVTWGQQASFRHYLQCLHAQTATARKSTFDATVDEHNRILDDAEALLKRLRRAGVRGQDRDFTDCLDANRAALAQLQSQRGAVLRRRWSTL